VDDPLGHAGLPGGSAGTAVLKNSVFICDVATTGPAVHAFHVALHLGLAALLSGSGTVFLGLGLIAHRRARRNATAGTPTVEGI
jgi:hypothetical protein